MSKAEIDAYIAEQKEPKRSTLKQLRKTIRDIVPEAEEVISYSMPAFRVNGKVIAGFAAFKNHLAYLPHSGGVLPQLKSDLEGYVTSASGSLHFAIDKPLPKTLVKKLIAARFKELREREANR